MDVVLDLMIHDLDIVLAFAKSPVKEIRAVGLPILSKKVDIANVRMEFESGCVANFTASRVSTERVRKLRFFQPQAICVARLLAAGCAGADGGRCRSRDPAEDDPFNPASVAASAFPGITPYKPTIEQQEPLRAELSSFLQAVRQRSTPEVTLEDGRRALAVALQIVDAIAEHSRRVHLRGIDERRKLAYAVPITMPEEMVTIAKFFSLGEAKLAQGKLIFGGNFDLRVRREHACHELAHGRGPGRHPAAGAGQPGGACAGSAGRLRARQYGRRSGTKSAED